MSNIPTAMALGDKQSSPQLTSPVLKPSANNLRWKKAVRCRARNIRDCAGVRHMKSKVLLTAIRVLLFSLLLILRQQLMKKVLEAKTPVLNSADLGYLDDPLDIVEIFINPVSKETAPVAIRRLGRLSKEAN